MQLQLLPGISPVKDRRQNVTQPPIRKTTQERQKERSDDEHFRHSPVNGSPYDVRRATNEETHFRHTHWQGKRAQVRTALAAAGTPTRQLEAFEQCGSECLVLYSQEAKKYKLASNTCKCRHCEPCAKSKANLLAANLRSKLEKSPAGRYRFVTLTLRHSDAPLTDQIKRLQKSFKKLRTTKLWKSSQKGGCAILEIKWKKESRRWHPHLHVIAEGSYLQQAALSGAWLAATGDSPIVDIRALNNERDAAHYVAKYMSKGTNNEVWCDPQAAVEWVSAMRGTRSAATWGSWRGYKLLEHLKDDSVYKPIGLLTNIVRAANNAETWAIGLLDAITRDLQYNPHKPRTPKPK
jgi:hypothetical protein